MDGCAELKEGGGDGVERLTTSRLSSEFKKECLLASPILEVDGCGDLDRGGGDGVGRSNISILSSESPTSGIAVEGRNDLDDGSNGDGVRYWISFWDSKNSLLSSGSSREVEVNMLSGLNGNSVSAPRTQTSNWVLGSVVTTSKSTAVNNCPGWSEHTGKSLTDIGSLKFSR